MNMFVPKEQGYIHALLRMHPKEGILSEVHLSVSSWVKPTTEAFIHSNQFLHYHRDETHSCELHLPEDRAEIRAYVNRLN